MKITLAMLLGFITAWALVAGQPVAAQERGDAGNVVDVSKLPRTVVAAADRVTLFVDWKNITEIERKDSTVPWYSTEMYTVNRTGKPVTIRRTSYFDGNSALEYRNQDKKWQRTVPSFVQWGACGTGQWVEEFKLLPGKCYVEPVLLQKSGKKSETVRFRLVADGKNYYSNPHRLQLQIDPRLANAADQDDWTITYAPIDLLQKLIDGKTKFARHPHPFVKKGVSESKMLAIQTLAKPWHASSKSIPILDAIIKSGDKDYVPIAATTKKQIIQREAKAKESRRK